MRGLLVLFFSTVTSSWAVPKDTAFKVKESVQPPHEWVKHSSPSANHNIILRIGLPQPNFGKLEKYLYEVSDPDHERYGAYLSKEETEMLVAPHEESISLVDEWLLFHGIRQGDLVRSPAKDWVTVKVPVVVAEKMLDTKYHTWKNTESGDYIVRTTSYSLPGHLHEHIEVIQPTTMFAQFKGHKSTIVWSDEESLAPGLQKLPPIIDAISGTSVDASCNATITIKCLQQLYNAVGFVPSADENSIGITGYLEQFANIQDLQMFYADQRPDALNSSFKFISVKGGLNSQNLSEAGVEANLDVQFAFGLSHPIPGTFYSTAGRPPFIPDTLTLTDTNEPYTDWLDFVLDHPSPPLSISSSYGDDEQTVPESFARRACQGFAQLGVRGVSVMFSSGDGGVGDGNPHSTTQKCFTNDGRNITRFIPAFPATCPFVTSVGGTTGVPEVAVSRFFSGGGFSNYFSRPPYQDKAVQHYLDALPTGTYAGLFNPNGRGVPDVAAQGDRFRVFFQALLNDVRLLKGEPPLGFLNPWLYAKGFMGLNDITSGHNSGCGTQGFNVTKGWDPVTGFGTPNFGKLKWLV